MFERELQNNEFTNPVFHSWCEIDGFVIDYHKRLDTLNGFQSNFLFIEKKSELAGKVEFNPCGKEINLNGLPYIHFSPPGIKNYFVKLNSKLLTKSFLKNI